MYGQPLAIVDTAECEMYHVECASKKYSARDMSRMLDDGETIMYDDINDRRRCGFSVGVTVSYEDCVDVDVAPVMTRWGAVAPSRRCDICHEKLVDTGEDDTDESVF